MQSLLIDMALSSLSSPPGLLMLCLQLDKLSLIVVWSPDGTVLPQGYWMSCGVELGVGRARPVFSSVRCFSRKAAPGCWMSYGGGWAGAGPPRCTTSEDPFPGEHRCKHPRGVSWVVTSSLEGQLGALSSVVTELSGFLGSVFFIIIIFKFSLLYCVFAV